MVDQKSDDRVADAAPDAADDDVVRADQAGATTVGDQGDSGDSGDLAGLGAEAVVLVRTWLHEDAPRTGAASGEASGRSADAAGRAPDSPAARLVGLLREPDGLAFAVEFVDGVVRPDDNAVAAGNLERLSSRVPESLPARLRSAIRVGSTVGEALPWAVVPPSARLLRRMVAPLIADATPSKLGETMARLTADGSRVNLAPVGEPVLGEAGAARCRAAVSALLARDDVDHVLMALPSIADGRALWDFDETVERVAEALVPLYEQALPREDRRTGAVFLTLDFEEPHQLELAAAVFQSILSRAEFRGLEAGITLPVGLPGALTVLDRLQQWASARVEAGGAGTTVRVVQKHPSSPSAGGAALESLLAAALTAQDSDAVRIVIARCSLFETAFAWLLAERRGVADRLAVELESGTSARLRAAVRGSVGNVLLHAPVVHPREFAAVTDYLIDRLGEAAGDGNQLASAFDPEVDQHVFVRERDRFLASQRSSGPAGSREDSEGVAGAAHPDGSLPADRERARRILDRASRSRLGSATDAAARIVAPSTLDALVERAAAAGAAWGARPALERATMLRRAAEAVDVNRDLLVEVMVSETGLIFQDAESDVSRAVELSAHSADLAEELGDVDGARFVPSALVVVAPSWSHPVSDPAGGVFAALGAGAAVVLQPADEAGRSSALLCEVLWEVGIPREVLLLVELGVPEHSVAGHSDDADHPSTTALRRQLFTDPRVDRVLLTGSFETAEELRSWRPDLPLIASTGGRNSLIVTPSADVDLAVTDVVASAFSHSGQHPGAAHLVILVGSVAKSARFTRQLVDAVASLKVGEATALSSGMGPIIRPADGGLLAALTTLGDDERWLVEPRRLDEAGLLWSPGLRAGVTAGSAFSRAEDAGPVLGVTQVATLEEAIALQNSTAFGLAAGIHSLDPAEVERWLDAVDAGSLSVNRPIAGSLGDRWPARGWKRSSVGPGGAIGGPNALLGLGQWATEAGEESTDLALGTLDPKVRELIEAATPGLDWRQFDFVRRAALSDEAAWKGAFAAVELPAAGRRVLRYRPVPVVIRLSEGEPLDALVRVLAAGTRARASLGLSTALKLPRPLRALLKERRVRVFVESDETWLARAAKVGIGSSRIRMIGGDPRALAEAVGGSPDVAIHAGEATRAGRIELLPFLAEQTVSVATVRRGRPSPVAHVRIA
ncbi:hypothetical protein B7R21_00745 [Subtercola boreus]|uniref:Uncharacterized protein n=1 Tax=Subtercola boreus TaxID=120213 RepID=A0A3E0W7F2_9MICO|nr:proline dehydrogenase family protein [Subtercola boreus]RFA17298.1 hypothetical protein B7R21_00745 [Subtercola boreus]